MMNLEKKIETLLAIARDARLGTSNIQIERCAWSQLKGGEAFAEGTPVFCVRFAIDTLNRKRFFAVTLDAAVDDGIRSVLAYVDKCAEDYDVVAKKNATEAEEWRAIARRIRDRV